MYPGAGSNGSFDPMSAAYYANLGNQQMAAAMAAAAVRTASACTPQLSKHLYMRTNVIFTRKGFARVC